MGIIVGMIVQLDNYFIVTVEKQLDACRDFGKNIGRMIPQWGILTPIVKM